MLLQRLAGSSVHTVANTKEVAALVVVQETREDSEGRADQVVCGSVQDQLVPNDACYLTMVTCVFHEREGQCEGSQVGSRSRRGMMEVLT